MTDPSNIAVVNIEWSDDYAGSELSGHFGGDGNEKYIFQPYLGQFYGYFPPNGNNFPTAKGETSWLIFYVSRPTQGAPAVVVGWYESASIVSDKPRPDADDLGRNSEGGPFSYSAIARRAISIPVAARDCVLPKGDSLRSFAFVRMNGSDKRSRSQLIKVLLAYHRRVTELGAGTASGGRGQFLVDPVLKKQIEEAAVRAVKSDYRTGYLFKDKQKILGTGYDLEFTDRGSGEVWCIEVKGTAGARDAFFITRTERLAGREILKEEKTGGHRRWRLALVTRALDPARRRIEYCDADDLDERFEFQCLQWQAVSKYKASDNG